MKLQERIRNIKKTVSEFDGYSKALCSEEGIS